MRIISEKAIRDYCDSVPQAKTALLDWAKRVKKAQWTCFADVKATFNSVDAIGNQHYVFNVKGNDYRVVVVIKFTPKFVLIRFIGTHTEYDKIKDCSLI